jgi:cytochrome c553
MHILPSTLRAARILPVLGFAILTATACQPTPTTPAQPAAAPAKPSTVEADVAHLKDITPAQSHTMIDVGYHMSNLWFAAQQKNWDLAAFEVDETRNRIRWTIRISPTRKKPDGEIVDIKAIFDGIDQSVVTPLKDAAAEQDMAAFVPACRAMLEACYSCHKASGKPYLRPMIPTTPPQTILNYDPNAKWPQ